VELSIIGAGRTGRTLGFLARRAGLEIGPVVCRTAAHAREAAAFIGAGRPGTELRGAALTIIAVPDGEIAGVVGSIKMPRGGVAAHTCASLGAEALRPLHPAGALHPLRSFADPSRAADLFPGTACAVDGDPEALAVLEDFVRDIGGVPIRVRSDRKALYHAGAVFASNYVVAALDSALRLFDAAGVPRREAAPALLKLAEGTLENVRSVGVPEALTGPVERGDVGTVLRHVEALASGAPELSAAYAALGRRAIEAAIAKGSIGRAQAKRLDAALGAAPARRKETSRR
jgi:predicted short-subunit dehydrogenase-like oxidoreductase (DUF2520 family)